MNDDPAWRSKVATQCGHSLQTASRYYEFSEKIQPGIEVVEALHQMGELDGGQEEEEQGPADVDSSLPPEAAERDGDPDDPESTFGIP